jgi:hypothetical protein
VSFFLSLKEKSKKRKEKKREKCPTIFPKRRKKEEECKQVGRTQSWTLDRCSAQQAII